jgi:transcriptional regulator with XRE-family HTH domain
MNMRFSVKAARVNFTSLTQKEVADYLGLSLTAYCRKENGKSKFYAEELHKLAQLFGVNIDIFFDLACHNKTQNEMPGAV